MLGFVIFCDPVTDLNTPLPFLSSEIYCMRLSLRFSSRLSFLSKGPHLYLQARTHAS